MPDFEETGSAGTLAGKLDSILARFATNADGSPAGAADKAVQLARLLQERAVALQTPQEKKQQAELERMMQSPHDKATLTQLTDQAFRSERPPRAADQLTHILDIQGIPRFFSTVDRTFLRGFQSFGSYLPGVAVPLVKEKMREETANVILPAEHEVLAEHLRARNQAGVRMNVNFLGEALLGEQEAQTRLQSYLEALQWPEIEVISVKISTIFSQISSLAIEHTLAVLCDRLELLYRAASKMRFVAADGTLRPKFVYLDMEEYRDLSVTAEAFMRTLDRSGLEHVSAGIALQAYVPDSYAVQCRINAWARKRVARGGAPVTVRLVKGANMEMERVEASVRGWPQAPFKTKREVDANYKRMLQEGMRAENSAAVRLGIATHNLFELAYGMVLAAENDVVDKVQFEMLEGMANHQRRALFELSNNMLLYAPATRKEDFIHAIGYLIRRLDENTGPDNFLRHAFKLSVDSDDWKQLERDFRASFELIDDLPQEPRRNQNRRLAVEPSTMAEGGIDSFVNEPDTDFALPENVRWAEEIIATWKPRRDRQAVDIPLVIAGTQISEERAVDECVDPSRPGAVVGRYRLATSDDVRKAVHCARRDPAGWRALDQPQRSATLARVAHEIRCARADLMGAAMANGGKHFLESDPEVSEAVDFVEFYRRSATDYHGIQGIAAKGKGVVAVIPPWNFPIAIPCGGMAAALAAGNTVIIKPAPESVLVAWILCQCFWRAGVPREALQFVTGIDEVAGNALVRDRDVDLVILTGGTATARLLLKQRPSMNLLAETGGKNATIVTALADRDQAVKNVLHSAFSHSGQKCSATSLWILEDEIYDDPEFKRMLCDAVTSLPVGSAWEKTTRIVPLIQPPAGPLEQGLKELEPGESWAVMPKRSEDNPNLYSPGVKWGVQPGRFTHMTELFGPVLGVMRAKDLNQAIDYVNQTGYGLTSGLESLDDREQELWRTRIRAGNLYLNRVTTGAVVLRQPFGGTGKSACGPGIKVGGPNYLVQLMDFDQTGEVRTSDEIHDAELAALHQHLLRLSKREEWPDKDELARVLAAIGSYDRAVREEFGRTHDHFHLVGQDNIRRYLPVSHLRLRIDPRDTLFDIFARVCAAKSVGVRATLSHPPGYASRALATLEALTEPWAAAIEYVEESDAQLAEAITEGQTERIRFAAPDRVPAVIFEAAKGTSVYLARTPVLAEGRIELLWYLREQSISNDYHRYGNLAERAGEERAEVL